MICPSEVESVRANGRWQERLMDYTIRLKDQSVLNPSNIVKKVVMYDPRAHKIHYICANRNYGRFIYVPSQQTRRKPSEKETD